MKKGLLIILSGPSGVGKGTVRKHLVKQYPDIQLSYSISYTTRLPRDGEKHGTDYFFISDDEFDNLIKEDKFLEYAEFVGHHYGTSKDFVEKLRNEGKNVFLEIETKGASQVMKRVNDDGLVTVFLLPPSLEDLKMRIANRRTESEMIINERIEKAKKEIPLASEYDYTIINDSIDSAAKQLAEIIKNKMNQ